MLAGAVGVTFLWRIFGVIASGRLDQRGPLFQWIMCVAYAMLAGLIARMVLVPSNELAETPLGLRLGAAAAALAVFFLFKRNLFLGTLTGFSSYVAMLYIAGGLD